MIEAIPIGVSMIATVVIVSRMLFCGNEMNTIGVIGGIPQVRPPLKSQQLSPVLPGLPLILRYHVVGIPADAPVKVVDLISLRQAVHVRISRTPVGIDGVSGSPFADIPRLRRDTVPHFLVHPVPRIDGEVPTV